MTRRYIVWIGLVSIAAAVVLNTSLQTRQQQDRLAAITREINTEQERTRVLVAEWHSLKTPERLEALARRHLRGYDTIKTMQLAGLGDVPDRLPEPTAPVAIAAAEPVIPSTAAETIAAPRQLASITLPRARPANHPANRPTAQPQARDNQQDEVARLIARSEAPTNRAEAPAPRNDGIRTIIERQQPQNGVLWASITE